MGGGTGYGKIQCHEEHNWFQLMMYPRQITTVCDRDGVELTLWGALWYVFRAFNNGEVVMAKQGKDGNSDPARREMGEYLSTPVEKVIETVRSGDVDAKGTIKFWEGKDPDMKKQWQVLME